MDFIQRIWEEKIESVEKDECINNTNGWEEWTSILAFAPETR